MRNPVLEAIAARRSIRAYKPEQITEEQLKIILDAAEQAPSARNSQPWHITAVQNQALIAEINEATRARLIHLMPERRADFERPEYSVFYHAPTVIFVSCQFGEGHRYAQIDCGHAVENMALAAHAIGLGSVILGMPREAFTGDKGDAFRRALDFPEGFDFIVALSVGTPAATKEAHPIEPGRISFVK